MQTRRRGGQYDCHNTPGDGTGFSKIPTHADPYAVLTDVDPAADGPRGNRHSSEEVIDDAPRR